MKPEPRIRFHWKALVTLVTGVVVASCTDSAAPGNLAEISFSTSFVYLDGIAPETVVVSELKNDLEDGIRVTGLN